MCTMNYNLFTTKPTAHDLISTSKAGGKLGAFRVFALSFRRIESRKKSVFVVCYREDGRAAANLINSNFLDRAITWMRP